MKKYLFAAVLAILACVSCDKEKEETSIPEAGNWQVIFNGKTHSIKGTIWGDKTEGEVYRLEFQGVEEKYWEGGIEGLYVGMDQNLADPDGLYFHFYLNMSDNGKDYDYFTLTKEAIYYGGYYKEESIDVKSFESGSLKVKYDKKTGKATVTAKMKLKDGTTISLKAEDAITDQIIY